MNEADLKRISFFGSIAGIIILYIVTVNMSIGSIKINEINANTLNMKVNITAFVNDVKLTKKAVILNIKDETGEIDAIIWLNSFKNEAAKMNFIHSLKRGDVINLVCEADKYKGRNELTCSYNEIKKWE